MTITSPGVLDGARHAVVICTRDRSRATAFYRHSLGLALLRQDRFAAVFALGDGGTTLSVSEVPDFTPHGHTILGFSVQHVEQAVRALRDRDVTFKMIPGLQQDALGIWTAPGAAVQTAWFSDPDGNVLSITNAC